MAKVYVLMANGVEEIEALTAVDILRRGGIDVVTVSITGKKEITGSHGIVFLADVLLEERALTDGDMLVLPGGLHGTNALMAHEQVRELLLHYRDEEKWLAAICAAPSVLGMNGLLRGKRATCYPGFEERLLGAEVSVESVVRDGKVITGKGMGVSVPFALCLLEALEPAQAKKVGDAIQYTGC